MNPALLILIGILTPLIVLGVLLLPLYGSVFGASYLIYLLAAKPTAPLLGRAADAEYMVDVYLSLFDYWWAHLDRMAFFTYTLPLLLLPLLGFAASFFGTRKLVRRLIDLFTMGAS